MLIRVSIAAGGHSDQLFSTPGSIPSIKEQRQLHFKIESTRLHLLSAQLKNVTRRAK
jgi:hypothetical protein